MEENSRRAEEKKGKEKKGEEEKGEDSQRDVENKQIIQAVRCQKLLNAFKCK